MAGSFLNDQKGALDAFTRGSRGGIGQLNSNSQDIKGAADRLIQDTFTAGNVDQSLSTQLQNIGARQQENAVTRTPWFMSTTEWLEEKPPRGIFWNANPSDITWSMPQRSMHTKNLYGTVLHVWPDSKRNTFFDEFRLSLSLQSGNLMPVRSSSGRFEPSGGLFNFYDFMNLVDAPKLTVGSEGKPPRSNLVIIKYNSNLFPKLTLMGHFDPAGIRFTDSSQTPTSVAQWSVDFVVYDTVPKMSDNSGSQFNSALMQIWAQEKLGRNPPRNDQLAVERSRTQINPNAS
jgi:hypothetical protein